MIKYVEGIEMYECVECGAQFEKVCAFNRKDAPNVFSVCPYCAVTANVSEGSPCGSRCDRCGAKMYRWQKEGERDGDCAGGNCVQCGDDLCSDCAGTWTEDGVCQKCADEEETSYPNCETCDREALCPDAIKPGSIECATKRAMAMGAVMPLKGRKDDREKLRWDLLPWEQVEEVVKVLTYGAKKYAPDNWKKVKPLCERYSAALMRHFVEWEKGNYFDEEAGQAGTALRHMAQVACNALFLLWFEQTGYPDEVA